jgi:hypothetical protein
MRVYLTAIAAAAAIALSVPAGAVVTVTDTTGTPLDNQIYGIAATGTTVYGSSPNNDGIANVTFTGDTQISVGSGFAQIHDANNVEDWYSLIINPNLDFSEFKFSTQLTGQGGTITVKALLAGTALDPTNLANFTTVGSYSAGIGNLNKLLSGGTFDAFAIVSSTPIEFFEVKQMSFNGVTAAVPEPGTWALMLLGFGAVGAGLRRSRKKNGRILQVA